MLYGERITRLERLVADLATACFNQTVGRDGKWGFKPIHREFDRIAAELKAAQLGVDVGIKKETLMNDDLNFIRGVVDKLIEMVRHQEIMTPNTEIMVREAHNKIDSIERDRNASVHPTKTTDHQLEG